MAVDSEGTLQIRGETGPGVAVRVRVDDDRIRITSAEETLGDWAVSEVGIRDRTEGFAIRAEGEEILLLLDDEVGFAVEIGLAAATPRLARKVATAYNPEERELVELESDDTQARTNVLAIAFALGGVMILLGGSLLRNSPSASLSGAQSATPSGADSWAAFVFGGVLMVAVAFVLSLGQRWARLAALLLVVGVVGVFGYLISTTEFDASHFAAYGFISGGIVVGVAVLFSGSLRTAD